MRSPGDLLSVCVWSANIYWMLCGKTGSDVSSGCIDDAGGLSLRDLCNAWDACVHGGSFSAALVMQSHD